MNDSEFIKNIAELWVEQGGDAEGLDFVYAKLRSAIKERIEELAIIEEENELRRQFNKIGPSWFNTSF